MLDQSNLWLFLPARIIEMSLVAGAAPHDGQAKGLVKERCSSP